MGMRITTQVGERREGDAGVVSGRHASDVTASDDEPAGAGRFPRKLPPEASGSPRARTKSEPGLREGATFGLHETSEDPVADSTDTNAFVSTDPDEAGTVTIITNYIPLEDPAGGANCYEFGDDVLDRINIDDNGDGVADVTYSFRVHDRGHGDEVPVQHRADRDDQQ